MAALRFVLPRTSLIVTVINIDDMMFHNVQLAIDDWLNRCVLKRFIKTGRDDADITLAGMSFTEALRR